MIQIEFDQLYIFNDENILGLPEPIESLNKGVSKVFDWIDAISCTTHPHQYFETEDDFIREIYFYDMLDKTKYKHYALKVQPYKREVVSLQKNLYDDIDDIEFMYQSEEDILQEISIDKPNYTHHLNSTMAEHGSP